MDWLSRADVIMMSIAAYVAVMTLVGLMRRRCDEVLADVQKQYEIHRRQRAKKRQQQTEDRDAA